MGQEDVVAVGGEAFGHADEGGADAEDVHIHDDGGAAFFLRGRTELARGEAVFGFNGDGSCGHGAPFLEDSNEDSNELRNQGSIAHQQAMGGQLGFYFNHICLQLGRLQKFFADGDTEFFSGGDIGGIMHAGDHAVVGDELGAGHQLGFVLRKNRGEDDGPGVGARWRGRWGRRRWWGALPGLRSVNHSGRGGGGSSTVCL